MFHFTSDIVNPWLSWSFLQLSLLARRISLLVSTYVVCERLSVMHKQVSGWTVNFCPNFPESPFLELQTRKPPLPFRKTSDLRWPKFTPEYPPHFGKLQIWDDQSLPPEYNPISENFRFEMTKIYSGIPPSHISENFRFEMTKVYSGIPPPPILENPGDRMWRLIFNPQGYHSFIC